MILEELAEHPLLIPLIKALLINALPVVFLALWCSMRAEELDEMESNDEDYSNEPIDRIAETRIVRVAYGISICAQILAHLLATAVAPLPRLLEWSFFIFAMLAQGQTKFTMEKRIRRLEATKAEHFTFNMRSLLVLVSIVAIYFGLVHGVGELFVFAAQAVRPESQTIAPTARLLGTIVGVFLALLGTFVLSPLYAKKMLPCTKLDDPSTHEKIKSGFSKAGLNTPEIYVLELDHLGMHNAMITGFRGLPEPFAPAMFISRAVLSKLRPEETEAVLLHEISHLKLHHIRHRFYATFAALVGSVAFSMIVVFASLKLLPIALVPFPILFAAIFPSVAPYLVVRRLVKQQEIQADSDAVFELGADLEAFSSALRRLDVLNDLSSTQKDPQSYFCTTSGHPTTEERIALLIKKQNHDISHKNKKAA